MTFLRRYPRAWSQSIRYDDRKTSVDVVTVDGKSWDAKVVAVVEKEKVVADLDVGLCNAAAAVEEEVAATAVADIAWTAAFDCRPTAWTWS